MRSRLRSFLRALAGRPRMEADMDAEMRFHMESYAEDLARSCVPRAEARRRARMAFGNLDNAKEECRRSRGLRWPDELLRNARYAGRILRRSPGFTATVIATLALCIGANTAIFSMIDAVLLRPLPYPEPDRLASVVTLVRGRGVEGMDQAQDGAAWEAIRDHASYIECAAMSGGFTGVNLAAQGKAEYVHQQRVTAGFFHVLGIQPVLGREFTADEDRAGGAPVAVLSHELWRRTFHGDPAIVGGAVLLRGEPHTVVGVMPAGFRAIFQADLWTPLRPSTTGEGGGTNYTLVARLRPGVPWAQAASQVEAAGQRVIGQRRFPPEIAARLTVVPLESSLSHDLRKPLLIVWGAVAAVLLIGCVNVAGLMLARGAARSREMATRIALGGGQAVVVRQLLTESLVLALVGGLAGVAAGYAGVRALAAAADEFTGIWQEIRLDLRVLAATFALATATGIVFGLLPALQGAKVDIRGALAGAGGRAVAGGRSRWPRRLLVLAEVALGSVLLIGASLFIRTLLHLRQLTPGFDATNVVAADISLQDARYRTNRQVNRLFTRSLERIRALPGVETAAVGLHVPYQRWLNMSFRRLSGPAAGADYMITSLNYVTPDYFLALRIPIRAGRAIEERDTENSAPVAVVNEAFVRRYLAGQEPLGSRLAFRRESLAREVVGVAGDVQQRPSWGGFGPIAPMPAIYIAAAQAPDDMFPLVHTWFSPNWVVRASGRREGLAEAMRRAMEETEPLLPFASFRTIDSLRDQTLASQRFQATLLGIFAGLALALASVGIYGLIATTVTERAREIGIRMALGASRSQVIVSTAAPGVLLAAGGVTIGCLLARAGGRLVASAIYGVTPTDPGTTTAVAACLLTVAAAASVIAALRLLRLDPASTLRQE